MAKDVGTGGAMSVALDRAEMPAATNNLAGAEHAARQVSAETGGSLVRVHLEADLVLSKIQMKRDVREGRKRVEELAGIARAKGFELIARKASAVAL
jgi:DNA-binding protein YbaB